MAFRIVLIVANLALVGMSAFALFTLGGLKVPVEKYTAEEIEHLVGRAQDPVKMRELLLVQDREIRKYENALAKLLPADQYMSEMVVATGALNLVALFIWMTRPGKKSEDGAAVRAETGNHGG